MLLTIPESEYHADSLRVSASLLDKFLEDRRDAQAKVEGATEDESTDEMLLGKYAHALVLEPLEVPRRYLVAPRRGPAGLAPDAHKPIDRRFKEGKQRWAEYLEECAAKKLQPINCDAEDCARAMVEALQRHDEASRLLWSGGGAAERVLHWEDTDTETPCRARLDRVFVSDDVIVELKTDRDIRPHHNSNTWRWYDRGYHRKAAFYLDGYHAVFGRNARLAFVFVENNMRPRVCVRWLEPDSPATEAGRVEYTEALQAFLRCRASGDWREPWEKQATAFEVPSAVLKRLELGDDAPVTVGGERLF